MSSPTPIWFITGASSGLGRALAEAVLARGWRAAMTARRPETLADLTAEHGDRALALALDVTDSNSIAGAVHDAETHFGVIDVLVNNAGYGYLSAIEEGDDAEIRAQFETNVFGLIAVTKQVLPGMRSRRQGHIFNVSSLGGLVAFAATGYYHATKFAVEGLSESLSHEVKSLGIDVTILEPGAFRTDWAGRSMVESSTIIDDYAETSGKRRQVTRSVSGNQPGDPVRAATAIISAFEADEPPLRLLLGAPALKIARERLDALSANFEAWAETTLSADFPS
ncbi:SDR family NAD(P)-dependent oxidoreductase [Rhizobium leguminosarum bv. viciae]|nr:NAD(P)-dependent dehydrogenase (short-subunit alcohol dehydrogenase family) [Rhizobium leguminosarum]MVO92067.1 SDR family NAD(P)-dependent oxidoreductase [Rhizobium leguminosarum bv. phaseoli]NKK84331.1 SDR family NAD(P)-dependent oxidoreductase [Rhizobium leguminosarum bv. viciae]MDH6270992.1 NAD(P)-dependent dehydrogenase (short-subunit alcohol dehydrogenase family) [Rhizobium leguminosarum]TBZ74852.1 oxidoreductase [Rhizobium leguminosarum bv. viciae]